MVSLADSSGPGTWREGVRLPHWLYQRQQHNGRKFRLPFFEVIELKQIRIGPLSTITLPAHLALPSFVMLTSELIATL